MQWREQTAREKRRSFASDTYWGRPVPYFGDPEADRMILGLAPAAHGANRTGRMFTGDRSGDFLFAALHRAGIATQASSVHATDGLELRGVLIAATCHCAPPANKPTPEEIVNCSGYFRTLFESRPWKAVLCLGAIAWNHLHRQTGNRVVPFGHGLTSELANGTVAVGSYHPSQQNTFTGRLTESMLDEAIAVWLHSDRIPVATERRAQPQSP